ncbi:MAG TPA: IS630 family transposase [Tepidisphaeraceae bacterium]|jgi:transposase|nr:IS630 family transposase [Tepidisphaeraceae bacterium]
MHAKDGDFREWRRLQSLHLREQGWRRWDVAVALDVTERSVSRWTAVARERGPQGLLSAPIPGRPSVLSREQLRLIPEFLWHGAEAYGFHGSVWTCGRVAKVIQEEFGVVYDRGHVSRLLKQLDWTPQMPIRRATQRNEGAIALWRHQTWPRLLREAKAERRTLVFVDESGFYLLPSVVKTYAPRAHTPVLAVKLTRDHLSVMAGMTPAGRIYTLARQESLNGSHSVEFLVHLQRVAGERVMVVWDGSPIHRRMLVKEFVTHTHGKIRLEALPAYAPDLNPWDEGGWHHLKGVEMRNVICKDLEDVHEQFHLAIHRLRQKAWLIHSFFRQAGLQL